MDWKTETVTLDHPITKGDKKISSITLREPNVDMLEEVEELGIEPGSRIRVKQMRGIIAILGDVPTEDLGGLHRDDMKKLADVAAPLLFPEEPEGEPEAS